MPTYLIEVSQPAGVAARRIGSSISSIGSHFATHAHWQQRDGMATGTLVVEADDWRWALGVVPPNMRLIAKIFRLEAPATEAGSEPAAFDGARMAYLSAA